MRIAVTLTTYDWDQAKRQVAERLLPWCDGCDLFVLVDETRTGPVDTSPFYRLSRVEADYPPRGLPMASRPGHNPLSWSHDYAIYDMVRVLPPYDCYVVVEDDVAVNVPLRPIAEGMVKSGSDCVLCMGPSPVDGWAYAHSTVDLPYSVKLKGLQCLLIVSRPAALALFDERTQLGARYLRGELATWAHAEGFVPSALTHRGYRMRKLGAFGDMSMFSSQFLFLDSDPRVRRPGVFAHSVMDPKRFERKFVGRTFTSLLQSGKRVELGEACATLRDLGRFDLGSLRIRPSEGNLALLRPATQSSLCANSRKPTHPGLDPVSIDAGGAVSGVLTGRFGFQTDIEERPWWQVDLGGQREIQQFKIFNSIERPRAAHALSILTSPDGRSWREVVRKGDGRTFAGPDDPFTAVLPEPVTGRFLRIRQNVRGSLHLDQVEVFGALGVSLARCPASTPQRC